MHGRSVKAVGGSIIRVFVADEFFVLLLQLLVVAEILIVAVVNVV